jgi:hypothetical protein
MISLPMISHARIRTAKDRLTRFRVKDYISPRSTIRTSRSQELFMLVRARFSVRLSLLALLVLLAVPASTLLAQGRATVFGTVTDATGAAVPNAHITLLNPATQQTQNAVSSGDGNYNLASIVPGTYQVTVVAPGFQSFVATSIVLQVDENRELAVKLTIGSTTDQVTVTENSSAQVDTRSSTLTEVVDSDRVKELPLNGRNPLQLQTLVAGAGAVSQGGGGQAQSDQVAINGSRPNSNNYTLDGADNEDPFFNTPSIVPNPDALDQFSMKTSNYGAGEGRGSGSQSNAITKSGTNKFHGNAFEYLRNDAMDALSYFHSATKPPFRRNQFGGTLGGPVLKDRLFFFFAYQGTRQNSSPSSVNIVVPSAAERTGNFGEVTGTQLLIPGTSTAAPNNNLTAYVNPAAVNFLNAFVPLPDPTKTGNQYSYNPSSTVYEDQYTGKLDTTLGAKDTLSGRIVYVNNKVLQEPNTSNLPGFLASINYENWNVAVNETHSFSTHLLNLFTFGYNNIARHQLPVIPKPLSWQDLGSGIVRASSTAPIGYETTVTGAFSAASRWPLNQLRSGYQYSDTVNWTLGNHNLSFGGDLRQSFTDQSQTYRTDSALTFSGTYTRNAIADLLVGRPSAINQQSFNGGKPSNVIPDLYIQDDWKITRRLTANLGLRWEPFVPLHDTLNRVSQYRPGQQSTVLPNAPVGYVFPGDAGVPTNTYNARWGVFAPRVGLAFDVFGDGKTSLRAGFGIYDGSVRSQSLNNLSTNLPYAYSLSISSPTGGLSNPYADIGGNPFPFTAPTPAQYSSYTFKTPLAALTDFAPNFRNSRVDQWNVNVQQQLPGDAVMTLAYVASAGEHLFTQVEANPALAAKAGATTQARRINTNFTSITRQLAGGHSSYNAFQATYNKRISHGVTVLANYTWARSIDNDSDDLISFYNPFNYSAGRGLSDFDIRNSFVTSFIWKLPEVGGNDLWKKAVAKGWEVNGIVSALSGSPFSVTSGVDNSRSGVNMDLADRTGAITTYNSASHAQQVAKWFNTAAYTTNAVGTFGNSGRNTVIGPGYVNFDFGFNKSIPTPSFAKLTFRAEAFNILNHANFANPNSSVSAGSSFGKITALRYNANPRDLQVALRLDF